MEWFIQLHRKMLEWEWYDDINTKVLFLHLLLKANWKDKNWRGKTIKRWQLLTWRIILSEETGLTQQQIRTSLNKLKSTNNITIKTTNRYSIIEVTNYNDYQKNNQQNNNQVTSNQPTSNQQVTTTNKDNNNNKDNKEIIIREEIKISLQKLMEENIDLLFFMEEYSLSEEQIKDQWKEFFMYWSEKKPNGKKEKWQMEKTFDVCRRFHKWLKNSQKWNKNNFNNKKSPWITTI